MIEFPTDIFIFIVNIRIIHLTNRLQYINKMFLILFTKI